VPVPWLAARIGCHRERQPLVLDRRAGSEGAIHHRQLDERRDLRLAARVVPGGADQDVARRFVARQERMDRLPGPGEATARVNKELLESVSFHAGRSRRSAARRYSRLALQARRERCRRPDAVVDADAAEGLAEHVQSGEAPTLRLYQPALGRLGENNQVPSRWTRLADRLKVVVYDPEARGAKKM